MDLCLSSSVVGKSLHVLAWDVSTGVVHRVYSCETGSTDSSSGRACLCVLGHDHILCSSPTLPIIHVWSTNKEQAQLKIACPGLVLALAGSPDSTYCAAAISDKVYIWEVSTGHLMGVASLHYQPVRVLQFTDDGVHLLSGGDDSRVVVWRVARVLSDCFDLSGHQFPGHTRHTSTSLTSDTPLTRHVWSHHSQPVTGVHCGRGGSQSRVATASLDQTCKLYELSSGTLLCSILFDFGLTAVTMDLSEYFLFVGGSNGQISQVNLFTYVGSRTQGLHSTSGSGEDPAHQSQFSGHSQPITGIAVATWAHHLISSSQEDTVRVWDIASHQTIRELKLKGPVSAMVKPDLDFTLSKSPEPTAAWLTPPPLQIQSFKKQLYYGKNEEEHLKAHSVPVRLRRSIDPLCDLESLKELECGYFLPALSSHSSVSLCEHKVKQELSEVKEVNKKLYKFMMEQLFEPSSEAREK